MTFKNTSVRIKLALLLLAAMTILAGTRGYGLLQLGAYLDRTNGYTVALDDLHQQLEAVQQSQLADARAGHLDATANAAYEQGLRDLRTRLQAKRAEAEAMHKRERSIMYSTYVAMLVVVLVVGVGIYWLMMALVVRPLQGMTTVANLVAAGDLTTDIRIENRDEIGSVLQALRNMNDSLSALIGKIRAVSHSIGDSTEQISVSGESLSRHIEGQADFLRETASTLRHLAGAVSTNAKNAERARELAASARDVATRGGSEVSTALNTLTRISAHSQKIGDIVSIIDGITFQTNILALNASVEAARAGAQGRGFAVVAAEVRSLAQRSTEAAKEIAGLINASVRELHESGGIVTNAGATMTQIVDGARAVDDIMAKMAADAAQQQQVIEQVRTMVDKVDQSSQQQALLASAADAAESMRQQAQELIAVVSVFRLSDQATTATAMSYSRRA